MYDKIHYKLKKKKRKENGSLSICTPGYFVHVQNVIQYQFSAEMASRAIYAITFLRKCRFFSILWNQNKTEND